MKRKSCYVLAGVFLMLFLGLQVQATEKEEYVEVSHVNPEYERWGVVFPEPEWSVYSSAGTTVNSLEKAIDFMREQMERRVTEITINVNGYSFVSWDKMEAEWNSILQGAFEHTGEPTEGDYINRHYGRCTGKMSYLGTTGTFQYTITYDTTAEQEEEMDDAVENLLKMWDKQNDIYDLSDYEKIRIIYDYICENVTYDYDTLNDSSYTLKFSAYAALIHGTAVCSGYANLFYRLALELDVDNRYISGYGNGGPHGWNIVQIGDYYYDLDSTWDAGRTAYGYDYFLRCEDNFADHDRDAEFKTDAFHAEYPMGSSDYVPSGFIFPDVKMGINDSNGKPSLSWETVDGAEKYEVYRSTSENGTYTHMITVKNPRYTNTSAKLGTTYYYKVRAVAGENKTGFSPIKVATCVCAQPVVSVSVNALNRKPVVTWEPVTGAERYEVERYTEGIYEYELMCTTSGTTYNDTSAEAGVNYWYRVRALRGDVPGAFSEVVYIQCPADDQLIIDVSVDPASGKPVVTWNEISGADGYEIFMTTLEDGIHMYVDTITTTSYIEIDAVPGTTYYYLVRPVIDGVAGSFAPRQWATCLLVQPVTKLANDATSGRPTLSWGAVEGAESYKVYRATSKNGTYSEVKSTTGTSFKDSNAVPGKTYYYKVKAICSNSYGNSALSSYKYITCDCAAPVTKLANDATSGRPTLSWGAVEGAESYKVYRATSKNGTYSEVKSTTGTSFKDSSAVPGKTYYYKVKAICSNSYGNSVLSSYKYITCDCAAPVTKLTTDASSGSPTLSWGAVEGAESYKVYRATSKNGTYSEVKSTTGTSFKDSNAVPGKTYYYKVKAICSNSYGNSALSSYKYITCDLARPNVTITLSSSGKPRLTWDAIPGAVKYEIYRSSTKNGTYTRIHTMKGCSFTNTSVPAGTTYYYKVRAICDVNVAASAYSAVQSITAK